MKRYELQTDRNGGGLSESTAGEWVRFEDMKALLERMDDVLAQAAREAGRCMGCSTCWHTPHEPECVVHAVSVALGKETP